MGSRSHKISEKEQQEEIGKIQKRMQWKRIHFRDSKDYSYKMHIEDKVISPCSKKPTG